MVSVERIEPEPVPVTYQITVSEEVAHILRAFCGGYGNSVGGRSNPAQGEISELQAALRNALGFNQYAVSKDSSVAIYVRPWGSV